MKKKIILFGLCLGVWLTSCNQNNLSPSTETSMSESKGLVFVIEGVFPTNDVYQLFYSNNNSFIEENSLKVPVFGQTCMQEIVFELPEKSQPQSLRLDFGTNATQNSVTIKSFNIKYKGETVNINNAEILGKYFNVGQGVEYKIETLNLAFSTNPDGIYDPFIVSNDELKKSLNKLYNSSKQEK